MTLQERLQRLAKALGMEPIPGKTLTCKQGDNRKWWLCGCIGGDVVLPYTAGAMDLLDALDHAEGWLAPELNDHYEQDDIH